MNLVWLQKHLNPILEYDFLHEKMVVIKRKQIEMK